MGITQDQIASLLRLAPKTLRLHYRHELDDGVIKANAAVAQSLFNMAVREKVPSAAIWWTKARMGWREATDINVGGQQDKPMSIEFTWAPATPPAIDAQPKTIEGETEIAWQDGRAGK